MNEPFQISREGFCSSKRAQFSKMSSFIVFLPLCVTSARIFPISWSARSLPEFSTSVSWLLSPGCVWRACSCTSCWSRCLRASFHAGSITTCLGTSSQLWWWASQRPLTTEATALSGRKCSIFAEALFFRDKYHKL